MSTPRKRGLAAHTTTKGLDMNAPNLVAAIRARHAQIGSDGATLLPVAAASQRPIDRSLAEHYRTSSPARYTSRRGRLA